VRFEVPVDEVLDRGEVFENGGDCLDDTVRLLGRELAHPQMASAIVLNSLIDVLLVQLLRTWLAANPDRRDTDASIAAMARSVGYTSQYAFSRAFTRARAQSPDRYRVTAREADAAEATRPASA
jgi:AraC-like DNA-binding protein